MFILSSCVVHDNGAGGSTIPPGQAKKVFGGSAKDYAPGQVKKEVVINNIRNKKLTVSFNIH